jgi:hypothetical protein
MSNPLYALAPACMWVPVTDRLLSPELGKYLPSYLRFRSSISTHTVRTVAADLRRGEHIPKMQNNIGRKSMLRVLRQLKSKDGAGGGAGCRTVPCRAVPGQAARRSAWRCVPHNCREFKPDRIRRFRQRQRQKHQDGLDPGSFRSITYHSTNCATLPL